MSGANYSYSSSDAVTLTSGIDVDPIKSINTIFDPNTNRTIFFYNKNNVTETINGFLLSCSGTTITQHATQTPSLSTPTSSCWTNVAYDTQNNKIIFMYYVNSPVNYAPKYSIVTVTGGATNTLSFTSDEYVFANTSQQAQASSLAWNGDANKLFMLYPAYIGGNIQCNTFTSNGSTLTTITEAEILTEDMSDSGGNETRASVFVSNQGISYSLGDPNNSPGIVNFTLSLGTTTSTVVNASQSNFVGVARSGTDLELSEPPTELVGYSESAITKGRAVIVKPDGNYAQAGLTTTSVTNTGTASQGSLGNISSYSSDMFAMAVASDGVTYCLTYQNTSTQQACKIGTRSGETISWGSEVVLASGNSSSHFVSYDASANVFVTSYTTGTSVKGTAVSFSGNTGTKGAEVTIMDLGNSSGNPSYNYKHWYDSTNKVTVCWANGGVSGSQTNRSSAVVLTLTGTSISVGTLYENSSAGGDKSTGCDITGGKHVLYFLNSSYYPSVMIMTVSSTGDITWGTPVTNNSNSGGFATPVYNPNFPDKCIVAGWFTNYNAYFSYFAVTVSGTSITISNFSSGNINSAQSYVESGGGVAAYSNYSGNYCFVYQTYSPYNSRYNFATTTDGLSLTVETAVTTTAHGSNQFYAGVCASDVDGVFVENHNDRSSSPGYYSYYCFNPTFNFTSTTQTPNMTSANVIGIAQETILANNDIKVKTFGQIDENQSLLTTGSAYFVNGTTGAIQTTADDPSVNIGTALNSTNLLIKS